jgi:hypothetical protein
MAKRRQTYGSFEEFWPYYVAMHSKAATRWVHLAGTLTGLAISACGLARGRRRLLLGLPVVGYGTAWPAHFLIEGNNPATFGHPLWSLRGDAKMIATMLAGRDHELAETARKWLAENPRDASDPDGGDPDDGYPDGAHLAAAHLAGSEWSPGD